MIRGLGVACAAWLLGVCTAVPAQAQDGPKPICADRPTKGTAPCTVDAAHWQVEIDAVDLTLDRTAGVATQAGVFASTNLKYGATDRLDLELNLTPLQTLSATGQGRASGFGDTVLRAKLALTTGDAAFSLLPYLKVPTAPRSLGNGALEGGVIAPLAISLPGQVSLTLDPELDVLENGQGHGRHLAYALAAGLSRPLSATFTGSAELWGSRNQDPGGGVDQASFDLGLSWIPVKQQTLQLDGGINLGLNRATPGVQGYVGVSRRF